MRCPTCKQEVSYQGNPFRPFCSERCKMIDLDNWLEGRYRVPDSPGDSEIRPGSDAEDNGEGGDDNY